MFKLVDLEDDFLCIDDGGMDAWFNGTHELLLVWGGEIRADQRYFTSQVHLTMDMKGTVLQANGSVGGRLSRARTHT